MLKDITDACKKFAQIQEKHKKTGASDTEPDTFILNLIIQFIEYDEIQYNLTRRDWELFTPKNNEERKTTRKAVAELNSAYKNIIEKIDEVLNSDLDNSLCVVHWSILNACHPLSLFRLDYSMIDK